MAQAVSQTAPGSTAVAGRSPAPPTPPARLPGPREKAAIIVRLLLSQGSTLPLSALPDHLQSALAEQIGRMRLVDRTTLSAVVDEFVAELEEIGLAFPGGIEGALSIMDGHISTTAASRLRRLAGASGKADPWDRVAQVTPDRLLPLLAAESVEVAAVILSKLPVPFAADVLGRIPGDRARRVAHAISMTGNVDPETVRRIGLALVQQLDNQPPRAFDAGPVERMGAILNVSTAQMRDDVLAGLEDEDAGFADLVRRAIFTFAHLPTRLAPRDVPRVLRLVEGPQLVTALAGALASPALAEAAEYLLANVSTRMAEGLRDEIAQRGKVRAKDAEEAQNAVLTALRQLEQAGEIALVETIEGD